MTNPKFTKRKLERSSGSVLLHVAEVQRRLTARKMGCHLALLALLLTLGCWCPQLLNHFRPQGVGFFVATTVTTATECSQSALPVTQDSGQVAPASPAVNIPIIGKTVQTLNEQLPQPEVSRQSTSRGTDTPKDEVFKGKYSFDYDKFTHDYHEYEQGQKHIIVKNRLKENIQFWKNIGANNFIIDTIENGYKLPLITIPPRTFCKNNRSALLENDFVVEAIQDLLDRFIIQKCTDIPYIVNPLTVAVRSSGKKRLILDLRTVNKHLWKQQIKFEDLKAVLSFWKKDFHLIKFDLTSAYHFVEIYKEHTDYLGFAWPDKNGKINYFKFLQLPFGLSTACYIFTKITRPLVKKWRGEGKLVSMYLDDGISGASDNDKASKVSSEIKNDLLLSGFVPNAEKSIWVPVQILEYLGVVLNSILGIMYIPERRLRKAKDTINELMLAFKEHRRVPVRKLASIVGQIISMSLVLGHVAQIMTKHLSIDIVQAHHWDSYVTISQESFEQLQFWRDNIELTNSRNVFESHTCSKVVYSDASHTGFSGYEISTINGISHGVWNSEEANKSSTWRELEAVYRVLCSLGHILAHKRVKWFSDNQGVSAIISKGSMKKDLQHIAMQIFHYCIEKSICLEVEWIPRTENEKADYLSKIVDLDDWGISFDLFNILQSRFGYFDIDWFASEYNAKVQKFYSRYWNPSSSGVDAFTEYWGNQFGLFVPPVPIIHRVLAKMRIDQAFGVIVVPCWKSALFWPVLCPNGHFIPNVIDWIDLPTSKEYYVPCRSYKGLFGNVDLQFRMLALLIDFRLS